jgi:hypothetical protein
MSEVRAAAAPDLDALALLAGEDPESVVLDFVQPNRVRRAGARRDELVRRDEADRRILSPAGCRGAPDGVRVGERYVMPRLR